MIAKILGKKVFEGLLSVTNEYDQLRACDLVPTKAHSQFDIALSRMFDSLNMYGLQHPEVIFTDNMADKAMLERHFPSLLKGVVPITEHSGLPTFEIPPDVSITCHQSATEMQDIVLGLIDQTSEGEELIVGLDTEWNVDLNARRNGVPDPQSTAILQLAHGKRIWIFQVAAHIRSGSLPAQLSTFLANPLVRKVGRNVNFDLKSLEEASHSTKPFVGGLDIARLSKDKGVVKDARLGLVNLCAAVLGKHLEKDESVRVSSEWSNTTLSKEQMKYAALDVWASLQIYNQLQALQVPSPLTFTPLPLPGTKVFLYQEDRTRIIACGQISMHTYNSLDGINISPSRSLIDIAEIFIPGAVITVHHGRPLSSFGPPPFSVVCKKSQVYTFVESFLPAQTGIASPDPSGALSSDSEDTVEPSSLSDDPTMEPLNVGFSDPPISSMTPPDSTSGGLDISGIEEWGSIIADLAEIPWPTEVRSRVLKDIFHVFQMISIPKTHGLRVKFSRALRDAIFLPDPEDKRQIESYLARQSPPLTFEQKLQSKPSFIKKHCKHLVPPPDQLFNIVSALFRDYGPLKDAQTSIPLFNAQAWKTVKNILELVKKGYISDPPGVSLYYIIGVCSKTNLPIYRCWRGTNFTEGGVHRPIRHSLPRGGVSPRHTLTRLLDFIFHHNMLVSLVPGFLRIYLNFIIVNFHRLVYSI